MPIFTVNSGGPAIEDGVYPVVLTDIKGPKTVTARNGPKAGQDIDLLDWVFVVADDSPARDLEITASTSTASGPRSKMFEWLSALLGKAPALGQSFELGDLVGRMAIATVRKDDSGWPRITNLSALPRAMQQAALAQAMGTPVSGPPLNGLPVAATPDLPF